MSCIKEFKSDKCDLTAICLNYPDTGEEFQILSNIFYKSMIEGLEKQFGSNWGTAIVEKINSKK